MATLSSTRQVQSVSNTELYNRWARVYDTDGNILQKVDDIHLPALLTEAFSLFISSPDPLAVTELGCGTGRNTSKLLLPPFSDKIQNINALDLSPGMLDIARSRLSEPSSSTSQLPEIRFHVFDALHPDWANFQNSADLVLSTLVLEHLPIAVFFSTIKSLLKKDGGIVVVTNFHQEMGSQTQAGFLDVDEHGTGTKVRGESYVYSVEEVVDEGRKWGFEVLGGVKEVGISLDGTVEGAGVEGLGERAKKWRGVKVWFGCILKLKREGDAE